MVVIKGVFLSLFRILNLLFNWSKSNDSSSNLASISDFLDFNNSTSLVTKTSSNESCFLLLHEFKKTVIRISRYVFFMIFFI